MELKHVASLSAFRARLCFNRTFMELKLYADKGLSQTELVLIGPSWN